MRRKNKLNLDDILIWRTSSEIVGLGIITEHPGIDNCLDFIMRKFCQPIRLKDMAAMSGLSLRSFYKAFYKELGLGPGDFLRNLRIEYAKRILIERNLEMGRVADQCGFSSKNTFCTAFRRVVGMPPKKFGRLAVIESKIKLSRSLGRHLT